MRIEAMTRRKVVVELSSADLTDLDITYDTLDYACAETRRVIWEILDRVKHATGCDIDPSGQMLIDAMPRPSGGCILFFTLRTPNEGFQGGEQALRKQEELLLLFEFPSLNELLDCAKTYRARLRAESDGLFSQSELFSQEGRYRLILCPIQALAVLQQFFGEYARDCGEERLEIHHTREHWQTIRKRFEELLQQNPSCTEPPAPSNDFTPGSIYLDLH